MRLALYLFITSLLIAGCGNEPQTVPSGVSLAIQESGTEVVVDTAGTAILPNQWSVEPIGAEYHLSLYRLVFVPAMAQHEAHREVLRLPGDRPTTIRFRGEGSQLIREVTLEPLEGLEPDP